MKLRQGGVRRELLLYKYHICRKLKQWARPGAEWSVRRETLGRVT